MFLFPEVGILRQIYFLREFVEDSKGNGFFEHITFPFVVVVFGELAGIGTFYEIIVIKRRVDYSVGDGVDKFFG